MSNPIEKWISGFNEPTRKKPDYYARTVLFESLAPNQIGTVSIRRGLISPAIGLISPAIDEFSIIGLSDVRSIPCVILRSTPVAAAESDRLNHEATMLIRAI